jgi:tetratricopeptide (TPR) repeat protein
MRTAMISSTSLDLPEHRRAVVDACQRMGCFPVAMEFLPARDADAIRVSMELVDRASLYIGLFAWRYGHIPEGHSVSITEMEFDRAVERHIPIMVFTIHREHQLTIVMIEVQESAQRKLEALKERASKGRGRAEFKSPEDLRSLVIHALSDLSQRESQASRSTQEIKLHPPNLTAQAPARYVAHPYTLLQAGKIIGRRDELNLLTDWITKNDRVAKETRVLCVVAIGGMGKSALTWKWFEEIAPRELPDLAGRMWWSFYESDAHFENFIIRALAYCSGLSEPEVRQLTPTGREERLLYLLDEQPFLLVLDGLERMLLAYMRMDAAHLLDDDLDQRTANLLAGATGLNDEVREVYLERHRLRQCFDHRAGAFLRKLTRIRASRVLVSTRLYPAELQTDTGLPLQGCHALFLGGLTDDDALTLWRCFIPGDRSGTAEQLLPLFQTFDNYPLLIRALAGEVAQYRPAPGDFRVWRRDHCNFDPASLHLSNERRAHVLQFALSGLEEPERRVLRTLAAFRMPAAWETLRALATRDGGPCANERALDIVLTELEDRGLVGWDRQANRYDLHPIVRAVVWSGVDDRSREEIYKSLQTYFQAAPSLKWQDVNRLEELTPAVELYGTLVGLKRYDEAFAIWRERLDYATLWRLGLSRERGEMIALLFPDGLDALPRLTKVDDQSYALNALATTYDGLGRPGASVPLYRSAANIDAGINNLAGYSDNLNDLCSACYSAGQLRLAESAARGALVSARKIGDRVRECWTLIRMHISLRTTGDHRSCEIALRRAALLSKAANSEEDQLYMEGKYGALMAWLALLQGDVAAARIHADTAWDRAFGLRLEQDFVHAARLQGAVALAQGGREDLERAKERLTHALTRARAINLIQEELPTLTTLAELHRRVKAYDEARDLLRQVMTPSESGPYPLVHALARNVLALLERDLGRRESAVEAAEAAYQLAWCDGPPFSDDHELGKARLTLQGLGVAEPRLRPYDSSHFEPMPDEELNLRDEFWIQPV